MNYEAVKTFGNEELETKKYGNIIDKIIHHSKIVQKSLSQLNMGQSAIFSVGLTINLLMAAYDVSTGAMTPGDFVMIQSMFMQLSGPLNYVGTLFRMID